MFYSICKDCKRILYVFRNCCILDPNSRAAPNDQVDGQGASPTLGLEVENIMALGLDTLNRSYIYIHIDHWRTANRLPIDVPRSQRNSFFFEPGSGDISWFKPQKITKVVSFHGMWYQTCCDSFVPHPIVHPRYKEYYSDRFRVKTDFNKCPRPDPTNLLHLLQISHLHPDPQI